MSLGGISKSICQSILLNAPLLAYFVKQRLNDLTEEEGAICAEENNKFVFLFNSDGSGNLAPNFIDELMDVDCPGSTSARGLGGYAVQGLDRISGQMRDCYCTEKGTKYEGNGVCVPLPDKCVSNNDCNRGDYCNITSYGSSNCMTNTTTVKGTCRTARSDTKSPNKATSFVSSNVKMTWWAVQNFCQAVKKTGIEVTDFNCAHSICKSDCSAKSGYCHADTSVAVSTKNASNVSAVTKQLKQAYGSTS